MLWYQGEVCVVSGGVHYMLWYQGEACVVSGGVHYNVRRNTLHTSHASSGRDLLGSQRARQNISTYEIVLITGLTL